MIEKRIVNLRRRLGFIFQAHNLFASLTALQNVRVALELQAQRHAAGTRIIHQGEPGDKFYLIRDGKLAVRRDPGEQFVAELGPGNFFGETALLTGEPRNAHVDALTDTVVYTLDPTSFQEAMRERATLDQEVRSSLFAD